MGETGAGCEGVYYPLAPATKVSYGPALYLPENWEFLEPHMGKKLIH